MVTVSSKPRVLTKNELISGIKGKDALLCLLTDKIDQSVMKAEKNLKVIANYAVGFDNVDVASATKMKIPVTNTPGVLTDSVADHACALIMSVARRIAGIRQVRSRRKIQVLGTHAYAWGRF